MLEKDMEYKIGDYLLITDFYGTENCTLCQLIRYTTYTGTDKRKWVDKFVVRITDKSSLHYKYGDIIEVREFDTESIESFRRTAEGYLSNYCRIKEQLDNL